MNEKEINKKIKELVELSERSGVKCNFFNCPEDCQEKINTNSEICSLKKELLNWEKEELKKQKEGNNMQPETPSTASAIVPSESKQLVEAINLDGLKQRLEAHSQLGKLIPENLKYFGIQYLDSASGKVQNHSCFGEEDAKKKYETLKAKGIPVKIVEGIRAAGVNMFSRSVGIYELTDKAITVNNLAEVCKILQEGKPAILYVYEKRFVGITSKNEENKFLVKDFSGSSVAAQYITSHEGLDKAFHSIIAKSETRALARAQARALGLPLQLAEDLEVAETIETEPIKITPKIEVEKKKVTSPEDRIIIIREILGKFSDKLEKQQKISDSVKTKVNIVGKKISEVPEEVFQEFIKVLKNYKEVTIEESTKTELKPDKIPKETPKVENKPNKLTERLRKVKELLAKHSNEQTKQQEIADKIRIKMNIPGKKVSEMTEDEYKSLIKNLEEYKEVTEEEPNI